MWRILILLFLSLPFCFAANAFQGGGGESTKSPKATSSIKADAAAKPRIRKPSGKKSGTNRGAFSQPKSALVTIAVSEPGAEIFLTDRNGKSVLGANSKFTSGDKNPITLDKLDAGRYKLVVRKDGYGEEHRSLAIVGGRSHNITINLRASVGFLTLSGNLEGATIEIEGVGTFQGLLTRQNIKPGTYQIRIKKNGYHPVITTIKINLGLESVQILVLRRIVAR